MFLDNFQGHSHKVAFLTTSRYYVMIGTNLTRRYLKMLRLRVKEVAEQQGLNQSQLQIKAGVNMGLLRRYWHNETSEVRFEPLEKIAHALGVKPEELLISDEEAE